MDNETFHAPGQVAKQLGVSTQTVRRYCTQLWKHLSEGASPQKGQARTLTDKDVLVLKQAHTWLDSGHTYEEVKQMLDGIDVETAVTPIEDVTPDITIETALLVVADSLDKLTESQQTLGLHGQHIERLTQENAELSRRLTEAESRLNTWGIALAAFIAGALIMGLVILGLWLG